MAKIRSSSKTLGTSMAPEAMRQKRQSSGIAFLEDPSLERDG
jgi:hypothetical protein